MKPPAETAIGFVLHAKEFLRAAELLLNREGALLPVYFLFGRSIELSLKGFLLTRGMSARSLRSRKFGHDLAALLVEARQRGLEKIVQMDGREIGVVDLLSHDYAGKRFEYRVTGGTYYLPLIEVTEQIARKLVAGLEAHSRQ